MDILLTLSIGIPIIIVSLLISWKNPLILFFVHITSRVILDGISNITYKSIIFNMSMMQIYSIFFITYLFIFLFLKKDNIKTGIPPIYPVILISLSYLLSGIISNDWLPIIENITKWIYMILLSGLVVYILNYYKLNLLIFVLWLSVLPAVFIQLYAIVTGNYSMAAAGHIVYYGGYSHQFMLSYLLLAFISSSLYLSIYYKNILLKLFFILSTAYGFYAIYLCGYRSSYLALIAFSIFTFIFYIKKSNISKKLLAVYFIPFLVVSIIYYLGSDLADKLNDVWIFFKSPSAYLDFSGQAQYTELFSGRIYIINTLMAAYLSSSFEAKLLGMGIDASQFIIGTYPHNELLAALVETGIFGFVVYIYFIIFYLKTILMNFRFTKNVEDCVIIGIGIGLLIMTLSTMPFRCMRAMIIFGLVLGVMYYKNKMLTEDSVKKCGVEIKFKDT